MEQDISRIEKAIGQFQYTLTLNQFQVVLSVKIVHTIKILVELYQHMLFIPCKEITSRLHSESAGLWIANSKNDPKLWLVAKLPNHLIRALHLNAKAELNIYLVDVHETVIPLLGISVFDSLDQPMMVAAGLRSAMEIKNLVSLLTLSGVPIQFHNENEFPLLAATCVFDRREAEGVVATLQAEPSLSAGELESRKTALNIVVEWTHDESQVEPRIVATCKLPLTLENPETFNVQLLSVGTVSLNDADQGNELEVLTLQLFDELFKFGAYHAPQRDVVNGRREVCDVLAVSRIREAENEGIFVVQNKVATARERLRTTERRGLTIQNNILSAIDQSVGAIKRLKSGVQIYKKDGTKIESDPEHIVGHVEPLDLTSRAQELGYGIILISDMHEGVDWKLIWHALMMAFEKTGYYHFVFDLRELHALITNSNGHPIIFENYLLQIFKKMAEEPNAMIRSNFIYPE